MVESMPLATTRPEKRNMLDEILFDILTLTSPDLLARCNSVCKHWYSFIALNRLAIQEAHKKIFRFMFLMRPVGIRIQRNATLHIGYYKEDLDVFEIDRNPLWSPALESNGYSHHLLFGCANGLLCIGVCPGLDMPDPIFLINPITKTYLELPPFQRGYIAFSTCFGFGYNSELIEYTVIRIVHPSRRGLSGGRGRIYTFQLGFTDQWVYKGFLPEAFGSFTNSGLYLNNKLYFIDSAGKIAAYSLTKEIFEVLLAPPVDLSEKEGIRMVDLFRHDNCLAVVILDYIEKTGFIWALPRSTSISEWKPVAAFDIPFISTNFSIICTANDKVIWMVERKRFLSQKFEGSHVKVLKEVKDFLNTEVVDYKFSLVCI